MCITYSIIVAMKIKKIRSTVLNVQRIRLCDVKTEDELLISVLDDILKIARLVFLYLRSSALSSHHYFLLLFIRSYGKKMSSRALRKIHGDESVVVPTNVEGSSSEDGEGDAAFSVEVQEKKKNGPVNRFNLVDSSFYDGPSFMFCRGDRTNVAYYCSMCVCKVACIHTSSVSEMAQ